MASGGKKKTTMAKLAREQKLRERGLAKQARKEARKNGTFEPREDLSEPHDELSEEHEAEAERDGEPLPGVGAAPIEAAPGD